jgi:hypothetical protein
MANWVAIHGNAAIPDSSATNTIAVTHYPKGSTVLPTGTTFPATGVVHVVLPTAPDGYTKIDKLTVDLASSEAHVQQIQIYYSDDLEYNSADTITDLKYSNDINTLAISDFSAAAIADGDIGNGIGITFTIYFKNAQSYLSIWSVGAHFVSS